MNCPMIACCGNTLGIVSVILSVVTVVFAFLAIAVSKMNSLLDQKVALLPLRLKILESMTILVENLEKAIKAIKEKEINDRTDFNLGFEWLDAIVETAAYSLFCDALQITKRDDPAPAQLYDDSTNCVNIMIEEVDYVFTTNGIAEVAEELKDSYLKYGKCLRNPAGSYTQLTEDEMSLLESIVSRFATVKGKIIDEMRLCKNVKPFSIAMMKLLFGC